MSGADGWISPMSRLRLDIAARVFTGLMTVPYDMNLPSPDYVERFALASLDAADILLARWKETTPAATEGGEV